MSWELFIAVSPILYTAWVALRRVLIVLLMLFSTGSMSAIEFCMGPYSALMITFGKSNSEFRIDHGAETAVKLASVGIFFFEFCWKSSM
jgi:hypothetical protein